MIHNYMVVCYNQRSAAMQFKRLCNYLYSKNVEFKANRISYSINISDLGDVWIVRFVSVELYYTKACRGYHGNVLSEGDVDKILDELEDEQKQTTKS